LLTPSWRLIDAKKISISFMGDYGFLVHSRVDWRQQQLGQQEATQFDSSWSVEKRDWFSLVRVVYSEMAFKISRSCSGSVLLAGFCSKVCFFFCFSDEVDLELWVFLLFLVRLRRTSPCFDCAFGSLCLLSWCDSSLLAGSR